MTLQEFTTDLLRIYERLKDVKDDVQLEPEQIVYWLNQRRASYISSFPSKMMLNDQYYQDMGCIPLCRLDPETCERVTWSVDSLKFDGLPQLVFRPDMDDVMRINLADKVTRIYYDTPAIIHSRLSTANGRNFNFGTIIGGNLYILPAIHQWENFNIANLQVIASEPQKVLKYNDDGSTSIFDFFTDDYPCDPGVLKQIKLEILTQELKIAMAMIRDDTNDSRDNK